LPLEDSSITPVEMDVIQFVTENQPVTVRQVADAMADKRGIARTTVLTHMERLRKKRVLTRTDVAGVNQYSVARPAQEVVTSTIADFFNRTFGGSVSPLVAYLTQRGNLSDEEIFHLEKIVQKIEQEGHDAPND